MTRKQPPDPALTLALVARDALKGKSLRAAMRTVATVSSRGVAERASEAVGTLIASGLAIEFCDHLAATPAMVAVDDRSRDLERAAYEKAERGELGMSEEAFYDLDDYDFLQDALAEADLTPGTWVWEGRDLEREARRAVRADRLFSLATIPIVVGILIVTAVALVVVAACVPFYYAGQGILLGWRKVRGWAAP